MRYESLYINLFNLVYSVASDKPSSKIPMTTKEQKLFRYWKKKILYVSQYINNKIATILSPLEDNISQLYSRIIETIFHDGKHTKNIIFFYLVTGQLVHHHTQCYHQILPIYLDYVMKHLTDVIALPHYKILLHTLW